MFRVTIRSPNGKEQLEELVRNDKTLPCLPPCVCVCVCVCVRTCVGVQALMRSFRASVYINHTWSNLQRKSKERSILTIMSASIHSKSAKSTLSSYSRLSFLFRLWFWTTVCLRGPPYSPVTQNESFLHKRPTANRKKRSYSTCMNACRHAVM